MEERSREGEDDDAVPEQGSRQSAAAVIIRIDIT
jgi:hypothetical protein